MSLGPSFDSIHSNKPLPSPILPMDRTVNLPPPPHDFTDHLLPPPPPPKIIHHPDSESPQPSPVDPQPLNFGAPNLDTGLSIPTTPTSPSSSGPPSPSPDGKQKKSNPLIDLIETEKVYVDQLTGIIRKVAAAWSRSNLPPPELDTMFRSVEGVYKANRSLHSKLKDIGTNPSSPKALGDLLMRWIDDLEGPYTTYCSKFCAGFDMWEPVQSNLKLHTILSSFSASNPPPLSTVNSSSPPDPSVWTLDALFLLPKARLKYYRKLYSRLLKSTAPGRSDHKLLLGALERLDMLLATQESRGDVQVGSPSSPSQPQKETVNEVVIDTPSRQSDSRVSDVGAGSASSSVRGSSLSSGERLSRETASTSISRGSTQTLSMPISDLERRLVTDRTLDIFTMTPKAVRLQILPPSLPYARELRFSVDAVVRLTPRSTGREVVHWQGHLFLLTDLFLVCEKMTPEERPQGVDGADMWLCYPPLAGKVLRASEVAGQDKMLQITIMRKETLIVQVESMQLRNFILGEFRECIDFASTVIASTKQSAPPLPSLNGLPRSPSSGLPRSPSSGLPRSPSAPIPAERPLRDLPRLPGHATDGMNPPQGHRSTSPPNGSSITSPQDEMNNPPQRPGENGYSHSDTRISERMSSPSKSPDQLPQVGAAPGQIFHMRQQSAGNPLPPGPPPSFGVGQIMPPTRGRSVGHQPGPEPPFRGGPNPNLGQPPHVGQPPNPYPRPNPNAMGNQLLPPRPPDALGGLPPHPSFDPAYQGGIRQSPSVYSMDHPINNNYGPGPKNVPYDTPLPPQPRTLLPSVNSRAVSMVDPANAFLTDPSPPTSPAPDAVPSGPVTSTISAQMKCKVFLQQQHAQWKSLGSAKLKLYRQSPTNVKQLVVEAENREKSVLISTIVLTDGVERVGKTGVAIELSDKGQRTGIVYMIQLRNENSAGGLFDSLLAGSDRAGRG